MKKSRNELTKQLHHWLKGKLVFWNIPYREKDGHECKPNEELIKTLLESQNQIFSVLIHSDYNIKKQVLHNKKYFKKTIVNAGSVLDQRISKKLFELNNQLNTEFDARIKLELGKNYRNHVDYTRTLDCLIKQKNAQIRKEVIQELLREQCIEYLEQKKHSVLKKIDDLDIDEANNVLDDFIKNQPKLKSKITKTITNKNKTIVYNRIYNHQLPKKLALFLYGFEWTQFYCWQTKDEIKIINANSLGSGLRENHGYFGHLFAEVENNRKSIPTYIISFDNRCEMNIEFSPRLVLNRLDLTGNYRIDRKLSEKILKNIKLKD